MRIAFENLELVYLALGIAVLSAVLIAFFRFISGRRFPGLFLKSVTVALILLSLSGVYLETKSAGNRGVALLDLSESNEPAILSRQLDQLKRLQQSGIDLEILPFAGDASGVSRKMDSGGLDYFKRQFEELDYGKTNLEAALKRALSLGYSSILLATDGFQTAGDLREVIPELKQGGSRVFPLIPGDLQITRQGLGVSNLQAPLVVKEGKRVKISATVENRGPNPERGRLEIRQGEKLIFSREAVVPAASELVFESESDAVEEGIREVTASFKPLNPEFSESSETIYLSAEKGEKILLLNGAPEDARFLAPALSSQAYRLQSLTGDSVNESGDLSGYSAVIFNNIPRAQVPRSVLNSLNDYVRAGGSFIMIGGARSFGLGGYIDSSVEEILPVQLLPPQKEEKRLNVAVQLLIDKSRSMAEGSKIDFAKEAAIQVVDNLRDEDFLGVMGFDVNPFVVIRLARLSQIRNEAARRIGLLYPNKGTSLVASIDEGRRDLVRVAAGRKHMLILTDGEITDAPKHYYFELVKQVRLLGITVSTVMLGNEGDESMLREMANLGGGAFYRTSDVRALPKIFIADLKVASGERTLKEESEYQVKEGPAAIISTKVKTFPPLKGYVQTRAKPGADLELVTYASGKAEPLLASSRVGSGKSLAFTSDANGRWSDRWVEWPGYHRFWNDILTHLRGDASEKGSSVRFDLKTYYQNALLHLDLTVYSESERSEVTAELTLPDHTSRRISLKSTAPGRYLFALPEAKAGRYEFKAQIGERAFTPVAFHLSGKLLGERKGLGFNLPLLRNLADESGGEINPSAEDLINQGYNIADKRDLSNIFIILAICTFLLEIVVREILAFRRLRRYAGAKS